MKALILGATGMLGHVLFKYFSLNEKIDVYATTRDSETTRIDNYTELSGKTIQSVNALQFKSLKKLISDISPDLVINCIGIIKQNLEAKDPIASISINALFPHQLALECQTVNARLIHFSTDCVFKGTRGDYSEDDFSDADDLYGQTKFLGELQNPHCITLRTSIIGHELRNKRGLLDWFLNEKDPINGYTGAIFSGLPTIEIARIIAEYIIPNNELSGLYHVSSDPISKYELLKLVASRYGHDIEIKPYHDFICDRSLNSNKFKSAAGYNPPSWRNLVSFMHEDFISNRRNK